MKKLTKLRSRLEAQKLMDTKKGRAANITLDEQLRLVDIEAQRIKGSTASDKIAGQ